eukprot:COSAG01_NODE_2156_length_8253_cov_15.131280_7_plen_99_part_00
MQGSGSPYTVEHKPTGIVTVRMFEANLESTARDMAAEYVTRGWSVQNEFEVGPEVLQQIFRMRLQPVDLKVQTYVLVRPPMLASATKAITQIVESAIQ